MELWFLDDFWSNTGDLMNFRILGVFLVENVISHDFWDYRCFWVENVMSIFFSAGMHSLHSLVALIGCIDCLHPLCALIGCIDF